MPFRAADRHERTPSASGGTDNLLVRAAQQPLINENKGHRPRDRMTRRGGTISSEAFFVCRESVLLRKLFFAPRGAQS